MEKDDVAEDLGEVALEEERKASVNEECDELSELEGCQVSRGKLIRLSGMYCQVSRGELIRLSGNVRYLEEF